MNQQIDKMSKSIADMKSNLSSLQGQRKAVLEILEKEYGLTDLKGAEKKLKELEAEKAEAIETRDTLLIKAQKIMNGEV